MKKNSALETRAILKHTTPEGTKLRHALISLQRGESCSVSSTDWPFKSNPAEYLYTMRRIGRTYSYKYVQRKGGAGELLIVRTK